MFGMTFEDVLAELEGTIAALHVTPSSFRRSIAISLDHVEAQNPGLTAKAYHSDSVYTPVQSQSFESAVADLIKSLRRPGQSVADLQESRRVFAKTYHPDLFTSEQDRQQATRAMMQVNKSIDDAIQAIRKAVAAVHLPASGH